MTKNGVAENRVTVVLGAQWGDEGKGKVIFTAGSHTKVLANREIKKQDKERQTLLNTVQLKKNMHVFNPFRVYFYHHF